MTTSPIPANEVAEFTSRYDRMNERVEEIFHTMFPDWGSTRYSLRGWRIDGTDVRLDVDMSWAFQGQDNTDEYFPVDYLSDPEWKAKWEKSQEEAAERERLIKESTRTRELHEKEQRERQLLADLKKKFGE